MLFSKIFGLVSYVYMYNLPSSSSFTVNTITVQLSYHALRHTWQSPWNQNTMRMQTEEREREKNRSFLKMSNAIRVFPAL